MYTPREKAATAIALIIAAAGVINDLFINNSVLGIPLNKLSIVLFAPAFIVVLYLINKRDK
jgi:hypothetical protein